MTFVQRGPLLTETSARRRGRSHLYSERREKPIRGQELGSETNMETVTQTSDSATSTLKWEKERAKAKRGVNYEVLMEPFLKGCQKKKKIV